MLDIYSYVVRILDFDADTVVSEKNCYGGYAPYFSFSPDGRLMAIGFVGLIEVYDIETGKLVAKKRPLYSTSLRWNSTTRT
ncbi:MAG: hypothetical protein ACPLX7_04690 [Candidatus Kapaibacteriota bacterium]